jgi:hypothetical protein
MQSVGSVYQYEISVQIIESFAVCTIFFQIQFLIALSEFLNKRGVVWIFFSFNFVHENKVNISIRTELSFSFTKLTLSNYISYNSSTQSKSKQNKTKP